MWQSDYDHPTFIFEIVIPRWLFGSGGYRGLNIIIFRVLCHFTLATCQRLVYCVRSDLMHWLSVINVTQCRE